MNDTVVALSLCKHSTGIVNYMFNLFLGENSSFPVSLALISVMNDFEHSGIARVGAVVRHLSGDQMISGTQLSA